MIPVLKPLGWERIPSGVRLVLDPRQSVELGDEDGSVAALLVLLAEGKRDPAALAEAMRENFPAVSDRDVLDALEALDALHLIENRAQATGFTEADQLRHFSNLAFLRTFSTLDASAEEMVCRIRDSHVLMLGVGGLGSNVLQNLCGLGVGRLTLADRDRVEERNFARQFVYRRRDLGRSKVERAAEWVREFDPQIDVRTISINFAGTSDVQAVLEATRPAAVCAAVDDPAEIDLWVNAACVEAGIPFVRGGMTVTEGVIWAVQPGQSACYACMLAPDGSPGRGQTSALHRRNVARINRGAGPVATLLGSLVSFELLRFLTGFTEPRYAGATAVLDLAGDCSQTIIPYSRKPDCPVCGPAAREPASGIVSAVGAGDNPA